MTPALVPQSELNAVIREICAVVQRHHRAVAAHHQHLRSLNSAPVPSITPATIQDTRPDRSWCAFAYEDTQLCERETDDPTDDYCRIHQRSRHAQKDGAR